MLKWRSGFTLVEILVIVGIMVILVALAIPSYRFFQKESDLNNATEEIINTLRLAQSKTLASERASQWGVYFEQTTSPHQYTLFKGANYAGRDSSFDEIHKLSSFLEIYEINLAGGKTEVVFKRLSGGTSETGNIGLRLISDPTKTREIYIESSGQIILASPSAPADGRIKDSRHVHFNLGWSIQNATTLKFFSPTIPQTEEVNMVNFFNTDKTEFDWEGTFNVGGVDQIFHIHTHSLNGSNTLLCIHRDRNEGKSNQEVIIYIVDGGVDKEIAHYSADAQDTVTVGAYGGTMETQ